MRKFFRVLAALGLIASPLAADQNDPALDPLFAELKSAPGAERGRSITREIWNIWHDVDDADTAALLSTGVALMTAGFHARALEVFTRVTDREPDFAEGWNKRATVLYMLDRNDESLADIRRTLELEPRHFGALSGLGLIYLETGKYRAALVAFSNARNLNPFMPGVDENIETTKRLLRGNTI